MSKMEQSILVATNREKGYINLGEILGLSSIENFDELIHALETNPKVTIENVNENIQLVFSFKYDKIEYFYKYDCPRAPFKVSPYNELMACEIANDLGIPHVDYDLAMIGGFEGLISEDFRQKNVQYLSGTEFLTNNHPYSKVENVASLNNLEDIWIALEEHYGRKPEYQNIVSKVMQKFVDMFLFDILTGQVDRHATNWWIMQYPDGTLDLQPLFDNVRILLLHHRLAPERYPSVSRMLLKVNGDISRRVGENLEEFLRFSGEEFIKKLSNSLWVISTENIQKVFARIEKKTEYPMSHELKQFYLKEFESQLNFIMEVYDEIMISKYKL